MHDVAKLTRWVILSVGTLSPQYLDGWGRANTATTIINQLGNSYCEVVSLSTCGSLSINTNSIFSAGCAISTKQR